jgi:hypothetical protein
MVRVPEIPARAPIFFELPAGMVVELALVSPQRFGIETARGTNTTVARKDLCAQVTSIGPQFPLMYTDIAAERKSAFGDLAATPAARTAPAFDPTALPGSLCAHKRSS